MVQARKNRVNRCSPEMSISRCAARHIPRLPASAFWRDGMMQSSFAPGVPDAVAVTLELSDVRSKEIPDDVGSVD